MKKFFVLSLLALFAGVLLAIQLVRDPGYILIAYGNHTFETSLFALLVALLLLLAVIKLLLAVLVLLNPLRWFSRSKSN